MESHVFVSISSSTVGPWLYLGGVRPTCLVQLRGTTTFIKAPGRTKCKHALSYKEPGLSNIIWWLFIESFVLWAWPRSCQPQTQFDFSWLDWKKRVSSSLEFWIRRNEQFFLLFQQSNVSIEKKFLFHAYASNEFSSPIIITFSSMRKRHKDH